MLLLLLLLFVLVSKGSATSAGSFRWSIVPTRFSNIYNANNNKSENVFPWRKRNRKGNGFLNDDDKDNERRRNNIESSFNNNDKKSSLFSFLFFLPPPQVTSTGILIASSFMAFSYFWQSSNDWFEPAKRAFYFWRRAGPIVAHYKWTQVWLKKKTRKERDEIYQILHNRYSQPSLEIILYLRGLFVKIGQVLAARPDFVPQQYVKLFATVQDSLPPVKTTRKSKKDENNNDSENENRIQQVASEALLTQTGLDWNDVFEHFEEEPLGSASIGQCHLAVLNRDWVEKNNIHHYFNQNNNNKMIKKKNKTNNKDGKYLVAVKIMHPNAKKQFQNDFCIFRWLCRLALPGWGPMLRELERQMMTEFDYQQEADNLEQVRANMISSPYANEIVIPRPIQALCSKRLLVMEYLEGKKLDEDIQERLATALDINIDEARRLVEAKRNEFFANPKKSNDDEQQDEEDNDSILAFSQKLSQKRQQQSRKNDWSSIIITGKKPKTVVKLLRLQRHVKKRIDLLVNVHGHQILMNRCFNGDPHPGNILELSNGKLGLIDYGQTRRLLPSEGIALANIVALLGTDKKDQDVVGIANAMRDFGFKTKYDRDDIMVKYARLFFDNDDEARESGCINPQLYLIKLKSLDPLLIVPDAAIFVARASYMFRGMGSMVQGQVHTSKYWSKQAQHVLANPQAEGKKKECDE